MIHKNMFVKRMQIRRNLFVADSLKLELPRAIPILVSISTYNRRNWKRNRQCPATSSTPHDPWVPYNKYKTYDGRLLLNCTESPESKEIMREVLHQVFKATTFNVTSVFWAVWIGTYSNANDGMQRRSLGRMNSIYSYGWSWLMQKDTSHRTKT